MEESFLVSRPVQLYDLALMRYLQGSCELGSS